jgi:hypothetical protein
MLFLASSTGGKISFKSFSLYYECFVRLYIKFVVEIWIVFIPAEKKVMSSSIIRLSLPSKKSVEVRIERRSSPS